MAYTSIDDDDDIIHECVYICPFMYLFVIPF